MKKSKKTAIILSLICILVGACMVLGAGLSLWDTGLTTLNSMELEEKAYDFSDPIRNLDINTMDSSIRILPSEDGLCHVTCEDNEKRYHQVILEDGTLSITQKDEWMWYETIGIYWNYDPVLTVHLPETAYSVLMLNSVSGDVTVAPGFSFQEATVKTSSGNIDFAASTSQKLHTSTTSGKILLSDFSAGALEVSTTSGDIQLQSGAVNADAAFEAVSGCLELSALTTMDLAIGTSSGTVELSNLTAADLTIDTTSGDIKLVDYAVDALSISSSSGSVTVDRGSVALQFMTETVSGDVSICNTSCDRLFLSTSSGYVDTNHSALGSLCEMKTVSGDIRFLRSDADNFLISTSSGNVTGTLLSPKNFITATSSGNVSLPFSDQNGGTCEIHTVSGDISIQIERQP